MIAPFLFALRILLSLSLYAFLLFALLLLWRGIRDQGEVLASRKIPPICLDLFHEDEPVQRFFFNQAEITLGRDPGCECQVDEDTVSSRHARLSYHHAQWWLEDLQSTNGTLLNGEPVQIPTVMTTEDVINLGKVRIILSLKDEALDRGNEVSITKNENGDLE